MVFHAPSQQIEAIWLLEQNYSSQTPKSLDHMQDLKCWIIRNIKCKSISMRIKLIIQLMGNHMLTPSFQKMNILKCQRWVILVSQSLTKMKRSLLKMLVSNSSMLKRIILSTMLIVTKTKSNYLKPKLLFKNYILKIVFIPGHVEISRDKLIGNLID